LIEAQDIGGEAAQAGEDAGVCADARLVFVEGNIAEMVVAVFDAPVVADSLACPVGIDGLAGQIEAGFAGSFPQSGRGVESQNAPLDADDGGDQATPVGAGDDVAGVKDGDGARFVAVAAICIVGPTLAERGSFGDAGMDLPAQ
jgi:hypothetical protein